MFRSWTNTCMCRQCLGLCRVHRGMEGGSSAALLPAEPCQSWWGQLQPCLCWELLSLGTAGCSRGAQGCTPALSCCRDGAELLQPWLEGRECQGCGQGVPGMGHWSAETKIDATNPSQATNNGCCWVGMVGITFWKVGRFGLISLSSLSWITASQLKLRLFLFFVCVYQHFQDIYDCHCSAFFMSNLKVHFGFLSQVFPIVRCHWHLGLCVLGRRTAQTGWFLMETQWQRRVCNWARNWKLLTHRAHVTPARLWVWQPLHLGETPHFSAGIVSLTMSVRGRRCYKPSLPLLQGVLPAVLALAQFIFFPCPVSLTWSCSLAWLSW